MTNRYMFALSCLGMLTFGIVLTVLGASLPTIITSFGIDKAEAGALFLLLSFTILIGSVVFGPFVDRRGYKGIMVFALAAIFAGLETLAFARTLGGLQQGIVLIGVGGGIVNGATNALVADISAEAKGARLSLLGVFFGIGAAGVPFVLGALGDRFSHGHILAAVGALVLVPLVMSVAGTFPAPKHSQTFPLAAARGLLRDPILLLFGSMLFLQSGMEITVGGWTSTLFVEDLHVPADRALALLSLYWLGMMLARLLLGRVLTSRPPTRVLLTCIAIALTGALLLLSTRTVAIAAGGVFLLGAGLAATFPIVLGFVGDRYAALSGTAFSVVIVMALTGGMLMPFATGYFGNRYGLRGSFIVVPIALTLLASLLVIVATRLAAPRQPTT